MAIKQIFNFISKNKKFLSTYNAGLLQGKAYRVLNSKLTDTLSPFQLSVTEWKILGQLFDHTKLQQHEIAKILEVEPPLITKLIDQLEKKLLVTKENDKEDKRVKIVSITEKGKRLIPEIETAVKKELKIILKDVSIADLYTYAKVLKAIAEQ